MPRHTFFFVIILFFVVSEKLYKMVLKFTLQLTTNCLILFDEISQVYNHIIIHRVMFIFQISRLQTDTDKLNENNNLL